MRRSDARERAAVYYMSGCDAVEVETADGAVVRIGTGEPERLADVLRSKRPDASS